MVEHSGQWAIRWCEGAILYYCQLCAEGQIGMESPQRYWACLFTGDSLVGWLAAFSVQTLEMVHQACKPTMILTSAGESSLWHIRAWKEMRGYALPWMQTSTSAMLQDGRCRVSCTWIDSDELMLTIESTYGCGGWSLRQVHKVTHWCIRTCVALLKESCKGFLGVLSTNTEAIEEVVDMIPMWTENVTVAFLEVPMVHILNQCNTVLWKFGV